MTPPEPWIQTAIGRQFPMLDIDRLQIEFADIMRMLAVKCRFSGAAGEYSVLQHCVEVASLCPRHLVRAALLHDAEEAYYGDIAGPWKHLVHVLRRDRFVPIGDLGENLRYEIFVKLGVEWPLDAGWRIIKDADEVMLATERRDLMVSCNWGDRVMMIPRVQPVVPLKPNQAMETFAAMWRNAQ